MKIIVAVLLLLLIFMAGCSSHPSQETTAVPEQTPAMAPAPTTAAVPPLKDGTTLQPGEESTFSVGATDSDNNTLTFWAKNLPPGATFDPDTRTFSWTPARGQAGIYPGVTFYVSDGQLSDSESINIIVFSANSAPVLKAIPVKVVDAGNLITFTLQATDPDGDELVFTAKNLPPGAQFNPPSFSWVPTAAGIWPAITFTVSDGHLKDTKQVIIAVR
jgi:hypothetical protein